MRFTMLSLACLCLAYPIAVRAQNGSQPLTAPQNIVQIAMESGLPETTSDGFQIPLFCQGAACGFSHYSNFSLESSGNALKIRTDIRLSLNGDTLQLRNVVIEAHSMEGLVTSSIGPPYQISLITHDPISEKTGSLADVSMVKNRGIVEISGDTIVFSRSSVFIFLK